METPLSLFPITIFQRTKIETLFCDVAAPNMQQYVASRKLSFSKFVKMFGPECVSLLVLKQLGELTTKSHFKNEEKRVVPWRKRGDKVFNPPQLEKLKP